MKKITRLIEVRMGTGLWGSETTEHTKTFIQQAIRNTKDSAKTLETTIITVSNEQVNVLAKGTEKQINVLAQKIRNCVITIDDIKIVDTQEEENMKKENCITAGSNVMVGKFPCKVLSIVEDDGIVYYEVKPMEFETFSRFVTKVDIKEAR